MIRGKGCRDKIYYEARVRPPGGGGEVFTKELGWLSLSSLSSATPVRFKTAKAANWRVQRGWGAGGDVKVIEHRERVVTFTWPVR